QLVADEVKLRVRRLSLDQSAANPTRVEPRPTLGPARRDRVFRAEALVELINAHYAEPLSVPRLAALANMPSTTAASTFRSVMGLSINEYLIRYRLAQALQRLTDTDDPILDVAFACGFGSASRFYDLFRQRVGDAPLQFRRKVRRGPDAAR
ncbi:MAG: AraC family transcriptional regulator, partial [Devosia sp.]|nr:AraC family transcriptional regulator [Devosia sp.]